MTMPNFLVIGAAKAGTTSLYHYLAQHPQIYMSPIKEPRFFALEGEQLKPSDPINRKSITTLQDYLNLFEDVSGEKAIGEVSPIYISSPKAPERIQHYIPDVKIIAILRDPVERAYSHFVHIVQKEIEPVSNFMQALDEEEYYVGNFLRKRPYIELGFYYNQLKRYFEIFAADQIKIFLYDDLRDDSVTFLNNIFCFLEVDDSFLPTNLDKYNVSGIPKNRMLNRWMADQSNPLRRLVRSLCPVEGRRAFLKAVQKQNSVKHQMPIEARQRLLPLYREDILNLQDLINRDLSKWLEL